MDDTPLSKTKSAEMVLQTVDPSIVSRTLAIEEEDFNKGLTEIIRRDFFPDVEKLETEVDIFSTDDLEVENNAVGECMHTAGDLHSSSNVDCGKSVLRLDQYLCKYQSEDDASFTDMMVKSRDLQYQKHAWMHEKELEYAKDRRPAITDNGQSERRAGLDSWTYTAKNTLMYVPDGVESGAVQSVAEANRTRDIVHSNTRLPRQFVQKFRQNSNVDHAKRPAEEKVGVDGKILSVEESPKVNGYAFMDTPQIRPGVDASPLMTWGSIEGTPLRLDSDVFPSSAGGPSFKMPKIPTREKLALKLADQVAQASREKKKKRALVSSPLLRERIGTTPSKSDRLQLLSPAARKLIGQKAKYQDKALSASYSPQLCSGVRTPKTSSVPTPIHNVPSLTDNLLNISKH